MRIRRFIGQYLDKTAHYAELSMKMKCQTLLARAMGQPPVPGRQIICVYALQFTT